MNDDTDRYDAIIRVLDLARELAGGTHPTEEHLRAAAERLGASDVVLRGALACCRAVGTIPTKPKR